MRIEAENGKRVTDALLAIRPVATVVEFFKTETASGFILIFASLVGLVWANSPAAGAYVALLHAHAGPVSGPIKLDLSVHQWVDDGLMALFFLLVGLEIKRELLVGELSSVRRAALPAFAAAGGMAVPALVCVAVVWGDPARMKGWAIPAATDIAFALAALRLAGAGLPMSLNIFLTALAVIDDLGAIAIIAIFYTANLAVGSLGIALACFAVLMGLNRLRVTTVVPYLVLGAVMWYFVLQSGIHATIAGVLLALAIPLREASDGSSPLKDLEHKLHPLVAYAIVPVFGLANAGVSFAGLHPSIVLAPLPLGIALGLVLGKQAGIYAFSQLALSFKVARRPAGLTNLMLYGAALIGGIGFTMSLFIGNLAFTSEELLVETKIGVFAGSLIAALAGCIVLQIAARRHAAAHAAAADAA